MTTYVTLDDVLFFADRLGFHVKDPGLLESAVARPATKVYGKDAYPTVELKAAALLESMTRNHGLIDGNKRTSWVSLRHLAHLNGFRIRFTTDDAFELVTGVAVGRILFPDSATLIANHLTEDSRQ